MSPLEAPIPLRLARDLRAALFALGPAPSDRVRHKSGLDPDAAAADFARHHAGIPARPRAGDEPAVLYDQPGGPTLVMGLYGSDTRLRQWLPGVRDTALPAAARALVPLPPEPVFESDHRDTEPRLSQLPIPKVSPRDAGRYISMGFIAAGSPRAGLALSAHRMLVLDDRHLGVSMLSSRHLRRMAEAAWAEGRDLPVSVNIGVPPAVAVAGATSTAHLPVEFDKLSLAGALAGGAVTLHNNAGTVCLPQSEVILHGVLTARQCAETRGARPPGVTMPEFLGYDGQAGAPLQIIRIDRITQRPGALFHSCLGPGREQSALLNLGGALTQALKLRNDPRAKDMTDLHYSASGGGMLLLLVGLRAGAAPDKARLARDLVATMPFTKTVVFLDSDIDLSVEADVLWAMTTRCNLSGDTHALEGFAPLRMDPSQQDDWAVPGRGAAGRCWIDATTPAAMSVPRSFAKEAAQVAS
ncbi:UbiD family decarboxylase [uncultured Roseobacter sp.]|uniref:UbiD family decarboxylase n=1 Tax=uncultured Roseobacter sp. TaxID=114847 RepID=UPI002619CCAB|nr:UbiD family decarboxylase [uncultured Roseobacter sp.]